MRAALKAKLRGIRQQEERLLARNREVDRRELELQAQVSLCMYANYRRELELPAQVSLCMRTKPLYVR